MFPMSADIRKVPDLARDMNAKQLIAYKNVFAHIMRGADSRFGNLSVLEIREMIDEHPESDYLENVDKEIFIDGIKTV